MPVFCTACGTERMPGDSAPCPDCGAPPYPHKTDCDEFAHAQTLAQELDPIARALNRRHDEGK